MIACKHCQSGQFVRNGTVRGGEQRYRCKRCGFTFIAGDDRKSPSLPVKRALAIILYSLRAASFGRLSHIFGVSRSLIHSWVNTQETSIPPREVKGTIEEMVSDEMLQFINACASRSASKPWIVAQGELWPGWSGIILLQRSRINYRAGDPAAP
jgi:transposase-like protein